MENILILQSLYDLGVNISKTPEGLAIPPQCVRFHCLGVDCPKT
jgi:hypothetical protein